MPRTLLILLSAWFAMTLGSISLTCIILRWGNRNTAQRTQATR